MSIVNMPIKLVKVYQSIRFDGASQESFTPTEYHSKDISFNHRPKVKIEQVEKGLIVSNEKDCVLIGWPNIAYIQFDQTKKEEQKAAKVK
jgi:hypothetical protein